MNTITHFLFSWSASEALGSTERDNRVLSIAGTAPDLDGLGILPDMAARLLGKDDPALFGTYHHVLFHGLFGSLVISAAAAAFSKRRSRAFLISMALCHLHLFLDLVGSRGPSPSEKWAIPYLGPFSEALEISWAGQWAVNDIRNILFTLVLVGFAFVTAAKKGRSPVGVFSVKADKKFVETVRNRVAMWKKA